MSFKEYSYSVDMVFCFETMWLSKGPPNLQFLCQQSRILLETMEKHMRCCKQVLHVHAIAKLFAISLSNLCSICLNWSQYHCTVQHVGQSGKAVLWRCKKYIHNISADPSRRPGGARSRSIGLPRFWSSIPYKGAGGPRFAGFPPSGGFSDSGSGGPVPRSFFLRFRRKVALDISPFPVPRIFFLRFRRWR